VIPHVPLSPQDASEAIRRSSDGNGRGDGHLILPDVKRESIHKPDTAKPGPEG